MEYQVKNIEQKWQKYWKENESYRVETDETKPKFYVLDMFPYPSGAGLHVGHPLGYIASDIYSRYKTLSGFNVLHPMGFDAFGLPAEQYAIQTGQHPANTTEKNIKRYKEQLEQIGFSYDWNREVVTSDPKYYKWTQWVFIQLFHHWFNKKTNKAESIEKLIEEFEKSGSENICAACTNKLSFTSSEWKLMNEKEQQETLMNYRLAFIDKTTVNWCSELGTVLANDEVKEGLSVRGGFPVEQKMMKQWLLRVSAYAPRLLESLEKLEWTDSLKEIQRNWIGRSEGAEIMFKVKDSEHEIKVFTTRPDTLFGSTYMVLAPEYELLDEITTDEYQGEIENYIKETKKRSERERLADTKHISGQFTGSYAVHPFSGKLLPIWISDYVLSGYGTGAIMAVPAHDSRDYAFAKHFDIAIVEVVTGGNINESSYDAKEGKLINSDFLNGLDVSEAIGRMNEEIEKKGIGSSKINYRLRDAIFSRQRYWGEPFPVYFKNGIPSTIDISELPLELPDVDKFLPTEDGQPPLGRAKNWQTKNGHPIELSTMPGFAGSSAYYLRYMDPKNNEALVSEEANNYWQDVDLYIGGTEHATGHLIYSRFWNKFLFDINKVCKDEPYKKLINQGMIQGRSNFAYRVKGTKKFVSFNHKKDYDVSEMHVDISLVEDDILNVEQFRKWNPDFADAEFVLEEGKYRCGFAIEKMSKSMYNVVNPDDIIEKYGADTLRLYEMFLGPIEQSKPWDTHGIDGVHRFLRKFWRLFFTEKGSFFVCHNKATQAELKVLHKTIKKVKEDIERFSFNTAVSAFMICINELIELECNKRDILQNIVILLSPFAPHISEELWQLLGNKESITKAKFPEYNPKYLQEDSFEYPVSFNGKMRFKINLSNELTKEEIEKTVVEHENATKWLEGKTVRKIIIVPKRIINIVVG